MSKKKHTEFEDIILNGKIQPQALEFEEAILGACMLEKSAPEFVINLLTPDSFYKDAHRLIWGAIQTLSCTGRPVDILTVTECLRSEGNIDLAGGVFYISQLTNRVSSAANLEYHARILIQKYIARQLIAISGEIGREAFEDTVDIFDLQDRAIRMIEVLKPNTTKIESFGSIARKTYELMKNASVSDNSMIGLPSKHKVINEYTLGYSPGVYVVAARPGEGKTVFCLDECLNFAKNGTPAAYLCAEMGTLQLCRRIFSGQIEESVKQIKLAKSINSDKWDKLDNFVKEASNIPLYIIDVCGYNIDQIIALVKELVRKHGVKAVAIDYLHLIKGSPQIKYGNEELRLSDMTSRIKVIQREYDLVIFELSQLTRLEKGVKRFYQMTDLKGSGGIEADADVVMFIYHPWMHGVKTIPTIDDNDKDKDRIFKKGEVKLIFAKFREDEANVMKDLFFEGQFSKFRDYENNSLDSVIEEMKRDYNFGDREIDFDNLPF